MNSKLILCVVVAVVTAGGVTIFVVRYSQQNKEAQSQQEVHTATTNVMRQLKPDTSPPSFPNK